MQSFYRITFAVLALSLLFVSAAHNYKQVDSREPTVAKTPENQETRNVPTTKLTLAQAMELQKQIDLETLAAKNARRDDNYELIDFVPKSPVAEVNPRLGASATLTASAFGRRAYVLTGGLSHLPSDYIATFSNNVASWVAKNGTQETHVFNYAANFDSRPQPVGFLNDAIFGEETSRNGPFPSLNHKRAFHVSGRVVTSRGSAVFVWGGSSSNSIEFFYPHSQSSADWKWDEINSSDAPESRYGASAAVFYNKIFIFGGVTASGVAPTETLVFDVDFNEWSVLDVVGPSGRYGSPLAINTFGEYLVLYGGADVAGVVLDDLWIFDTNFDNWIPIEYTNDTTTKPPGSVFHGCSVNYLPDESSPFALDSFFTIFLGEREDAADTWVFDLSAFSWFVNKHENNRPRPAFKVGFAFATTLFGNSVTFGGLREDKGELEAVTWSFVAISSLPKIDPNWFRDLCYPSYHWDSKSFSCVAGDDEGCTDCYDYSEVQQKYVLGLKQKSIAGDKSGVVHQCPAAWRHETTTETDPQN